MREFMQRFYTALMLVVIGVSSYLLLPSWISSLLLGAVLIFILWFEWPKFKIPLLTPLYPILPFIAMIALNQSKQPWLLGLACIITFSFDSGAYIIGKSYGKHKIIPSISPGKSYEGFVGGYLVSLCTTYLFLQYKRILISFSAFAFFIFCMALLSFLGDLFESYLKRRVNLKDSGTFLPGHGGFLDRFDGLMFVAPAIYLFTMLQ